MKRSNPTPEIKEKFIYLKKIKCKILLISIRHNIFLIYEPKCRVIMSLNTNDKIINHYIARKILVEKLDKYLIINNVATRKNMGNDYGRKLLNKYIELNKKYDKFYILKLDISKYFYSIDHDVLQDIVEYFFHDPDIIWLLKELLLKLMN